MTDKQFSDEELCAYLDGELSQDVADRINASLAVDPELAQRLETLKFPIDALQFGADELLKNAPEFVEPGFQSDQKPTMQFFPYAAVLLIGIAVGYFGSIFLPDQKSDGWITAVASYQALYSKETLAGTGASSKSSIEVLNSFGETQTLPVAKFTNLPSLKFKRAQLLAFDGKPLLQMAFTTVDGQPVALCITPVAESDRVPNFGAYESLPAADWVENGKGFILIGDMKSDDMRSAVRIIRDQLG